MCNIFFRNSFAQCILFDLNSEKGIFLHNPCYIKIIRMKKLVIISSLVAAVAFVVSCHKTTTTTPTGTQTLELPATQYKYFTGNVSDSTADAKATLGRVLFYDQTLSVNNGVSCASCHKQALGFADNMALSMGFDGRPTLRNSKGIHTLLPNSSRMFFGTLDQMMTTMRTPLFWDGRSDNIVDLVKRPITNHIEMGINNVDQLVSKVNSIAYYPDLFNKAFGSSEVTMDKISSALGAFMVSLNTGNSKFDLSLTKGGTLNSLEQRGKDLFFGTYNCANCHLVSTNSYSTEDTNSFRDIGLDINYTDLGRGVVLGANTSNNKGKFRVPTLANVALTAPYMHDGRYKTLDEVIEHYSHNVKGSDNLDPILRNSDGTPRKMNIPDADKQALIAFLNTMTDLTSITDVRFSNPFKIK